jgi:hypothetical protein
MLNKIDEMCIDPRDVLVPFAADQLAVLPRRYERVGLGTTCRG